MATISKLTVDLELAATNFNNGLKSAQKEAKEFEKTIKPSKEFLKDMGMAATAAGAAITGAFGAMVVQAANYGDAMRDAGIRTASTTEEMSAMKYLAEQSGTSFETLTTGLKFLSKNADANATAFKSLGIETRDATGHTKSAKDLFGEVTGKLSDMADGSGKTAIMLKLFGRAGVDLTEVVSGGQAAIDAATAATERFGTAVGADAAAAADTFNDSLNDMKQAQLGLSLSIGAALIPTLTAVATAITETIVQVKNFALAHPDLIRAVGVLAVGLTGAGGLLLGLSGLLMILPQIKVAFAVLTGPIGLTVTALAAVAAAAIYFRKELALGLVAAFATVLTGFEKLLAGAGKVARALGADGMADKIGEAKFALEGYRRGLDEVITASMAEYGVIQQTQRAMRDEKDVRDEATESIGDHTEAIENARRKALQLKDEAARLWFALRDANGIELPINRLALSYDGLFASVSAVEGAVAATTVALNTNIATNGQLDDALKAINQTQTVGLTRDAERFEGMKKKADEAAAKLKEATEDVKRSAGEIFDAMLLKGENVFTSLGNALKGGALSLGRSIFEDIAGALLGPIKNAFDSFFSGLLESTGIKTFLAGLGEKLGKTISGAFDGASSAASNAGNVGGNVGGGGGGGGDTGGGGGGGIGGGDPISMIANALGQFAIVMQLKRIEGTLNAVEWNTRYTQIQLKDTMEQILWPMHGFLDYMADTIVRQLDVIISTMTNGMEAAFAAMKDVERAVKTVAPEVNTQTETSAVKSKADILEGFKQLSNAIASTFNAAFKSGKDLGNDIFGGNTAGNNFKDLSSNGRVRYETGPFGRRPVSTDPRTIGRKGYAPPPPNPPRTPTVIVFQVDKRELGRITLDAQNELVRSGGYKSIATDLKT